MTAPAETAHTPTAAPAHTVFTPETVPPPAQAAVAPRRKERITFDDPEYRALVRRLCCTVLDGNGHVDMGKSATDDEFDAFCRFCERLQVDPLARQANFMKRGGEDRKVGRGELSIDALRLVAERTGDYCGQTPREWCDVDISGGTATLTWYPVWPFGTAKQPLAARVGVYRRGFAEPLYAVARFEAYKQTKYGGGLNSMWTKMGPEQLGKCAEALALRQGFPNELSGVYTVDEMAHLDVEQAPRAQQRRAATTSTRNATSTQAEPVVEQAHPAAIVPTADNIATLYPYRPYKYVPLHGKHAGAYVIPVEVLQDRERQTSDKLKGLPETDPKHAKLVRLLDAIADELERRADEDEAAGKQDETAPPAAEDGAGATNAAPASTQAATDTVTAPAAAGTEAPQPTPDAQGDR